MSSYDIILKWAKDASIFLKKGEVRSAEINLMMIISQVKEEIADQKRENKKMIISQAKEEIANKKKKGK